MEDDTFGKIVILTFEDTEEQIMNRILSEGCGAAWCCADPGVVFCYGEVVEEAGRVCEEE